MSAPVNVRLKAPTVAIPGWVQQADAWTELNAEAGGNRDFYPLTVKAAYVIGVVHDLCESVSHLLAHPSAKTVTYIPAYGVFASGVELLGRCLVGDSGSTQAVKDLKTGFRWLAGSLSSTVTDSHVLVTTSTRAYTIEMLAALRHFAAHGQAASRVTGSGAGQFTDVDHELLGPMPTLTANGLERYWNELQSSEDLCNNLARAGVVAFRDWPVFHSWVLFERDTAGQYHSITEIFNRFNWQVHQRQAG